MTVPAPAASTGPDASADTAPAPEAGQSDIQPSGDDTGPADNDGQDTDDDADDDGPEKGRAARQAAKYRTQLREARDSLVAATAALGLQQQAIVDAAIAAAGFDPAFSKLLDSIVELDDLTNDSGLISAAKLDEAIVTTAKAFGVAPKQRPPAPTPGQGRPSGLAGGATFGSLLRDAARGR